LARVFHNAQRDKGDKGYNPVGITIEEARPYARKFKVLGREGLHYIAKYGREPAWFRQAYISKYHTPPPH
jgi:hypothetical protein